ncbi:SRPBCC family protein [Flavobacteriaceae bacterium S356]|uniref:SRPBCC family protein n=1 Tax=Asprobacillus argus TaxID=3076534 RepID=A0ABU3LGV9_9FLAO|nr:SRPBCC family protein [Flavobacteriaceae bacterium S356]
MKAIKVILGIIIALTVVFFATGLLIKEVNYEAKVEVNKPLNEVFAMFNDNNNLKQWIPELKSIVALDKKIGVTGSRYRMIVTDGNGNDIIMEEKVLAYIENEKVTLFFDAQGMLKTDDYTFTSDGSKTIITNRSTCKSDSYIFGCMMPYFKGTFKEIDQGYLNNFKAFAEKQ